jgi:flagellar biosynthesis GTPase FlhF
MSAVFNAPSFNARVEVTELLTKTLENVSKELASRCIKECGLKYGFNAEEAIRELGLENLSLLKKKMSRKSVSVSSGPKEKKAKEAKKSVFPLPFVNVLVNKSGCQGLAFNRGLFTQCLKSRMENGGFCKGCQSEADQNASGCPDCGTVESRLNTGLYEFKDPKGRSPVSYLKVLTKLKLTEEQAIAEAEKQGLEIPSEHLVVIEKVKKTPISRGRPKKIGGAVEAENVNDLFKQLGLDSDEEVSEEPEESEEISEKPVKASKKTKLSEEEKTAKKEALEKERQEKKEAREAQRKAEAEQKKLEREEKLEAEKEAKKAKIEAEKKERQEKREAEKAEKAASKEPKKSKKSVQTPVVTPVVTPVQEPVALTADAVVPAVPEEAPKKTTVTRIQISGKSYLKSSANILYDPNTKEEVGLWNPVTKKIEELPEEEEEEEEEEEYV